MKIEKLTENKIRIIIKAEDLPNNGMDMASLFTSSAVDTEKLFFKMLEKAEKELDFHTDGYKLLIEAFSSSDDILVFTITKYIPTENNSSLVQIPKRRLTVKRKTINTSKKHGIYQFDKFETFCDFCNCINQIHEFDINKFAKNVSLYLYNDTYFLVVKNIDTNYKFLNRFYSSVSEFSKLSSYSESFENKLLEHGEIIMKKNAIGLAIEYFVKRWDYGDVP